jgi:hypothetical protein
MAEACAVVGLISSIIQFVDIGNRVVARLDDFLSCVDEVPKTFDDINRQLPLLINTLNQARDQADSGHITNETAKALGPVVDGCLAQVQKLEDIMARTIPTENESPWIRRFKAFSSLAHDKTVQRIRTEIDRYVLNLIYHQSIANQNSLSIRESSQRKPLFTVTFGRDPNFVGREDLIKEIDERLKTGYRRVPLAGIGGVG